MTLNRDSMLLSSPTLLERIDQLRDLNIGQHVPLPQLVVVGDQSSGKSSLLGSLTGIPFPRDQSLCTRHATQITSRRGNKTFVKISIIPGPRATEEHRKNIEAFRVTVSSSAEFREQFVDILKKANERMGLRDDLLDGHGAVFSEDVLKVEVHGPDEDYLTIIDVPGIFRTTTHGTTTDDMAMVRALVKSYIKEDRTIILAVLPSNVDIATQEILQLAEEFDKNGERTLGVLTKPDLVLEPGEQAAVCDLVQGKKRPLTLGYFLIRNRGSQSEDIEQSQLDQLFQQRPWYDLPHDRVGIPALKEQLGSLLVEISRREFPKLLQDVINQIKECGKELDSLGPPRQDERDQRRFLSLIAGMFQDCARAALAADYNADAAFVEDDLRLITHVANITDVFNADFQESGHSRRFENIDLTIPSDVSDVSSDPERDEESIDLMTTRLRALLEKASVDIVTPTERAELGDIVLLPRQTARPSGSVMDWIDSFYLRFRGLDLGTFNANLVSVAFAEQTRKWEHMTKVYMSRVIVTLHRFIAAALRSVCPDEMAHDQLWSAILQSLVERYQLAMNQTSLLIEVEQRKHPYTLNRRFTEAISKARGQRMTELLRARARKDTKQYGETQLMVNLHDIANVAESKSNVEHLQEEIHDILRAYYSLALDRFIDNVFQLAVDHHLLHGPSSPLKVFSQDWVINLQPDQLERIVGETKSAKRRRTRLTKKIDDLSKALKILGAY